MIINLKSPPEPRRFNDVSDAQGYANILYRYIDAMRIELNRVLSNLDDANILSLSADKVSGLFVSEDSGTNSGEETTEGSEVTNGE